MRILVTTASGANGDGYGAILGFGSDCEFTGPFSSDPRIADPRGLSPDPSGALVYLNSGDDRMLALVTRMRIRTVLCRRLPDRRQRPQEPAGQAAGSALLLRDGEVTALAWLRAARKRCWAPCLVSP